MADEPVSEQSARSQRLRRRIYRPPNAPSFRRRPFSRQKQINHLSQIFYSESSKHSKYFTIYTVSTLHFFALLVDYYTVKFTCFAVSIFVLSLAQKRLLFSC